MDIQDSLKLPEKRNLCEVLKVDPLCNSSCRVRDYFSSRMNFYVKSLLHLESGPPKEVLVCYANPFFEPCANNFFQGLDAKMSQYLEQVNPHLELTSEKPIPGVHSFDFSRSLKDMEIRQNYNFELMASRPDPFDPLAVPIERYVRSSINARVQDSPLSFLIYSAPEDYALAQKVIQKVTKDMAKELTPLTLIKPLVLIEHGIPLQFPGSYTIDLDHIVHEALDPQKK